MLCDDDDDDYEEYDNGDDDDDDDEYTNTFSASCSFYSYTPHFPSPTPSFTMLTIHHRISI